MQQQNDNHAQSTAAGVQIAPTWRSVLPAILLALTDGTRDGQAQARALFSDMAEIADHATAARVQLQKLVDAFPQFDVDEDDDDNPISPDVNGADAVEWLEEFREEVKAFLAQPVPKK